MYHFAYIFKKFIYLNGRVTKEREKQRQGEREFSIYGFTAQMATAAGVDPVQGQEQGASSAFFWISQVGGGSAWAIFCFFSRPLVGN